jgi:hypothetical protein
VDTDKNPISDWDRGGIRVLDINGNEVLFVPSADIIAVGDNPAENTLLGAANGLELYRLVGGGFQLNGLDEHGQLFEFIFYNCLPIGPIPNTHNDDCTPVYVYVIKVSAEDLKLKGMDSIPRVLVEEGDCVIYCVRKQVGKDFILDRGRLNGCEITCKVTYSKDAILPRGIC